MKFSVRSFVFLAAAAAVFSASGFAADGSQATDKSYPLKTCVVSGEPLGDMGDPVEYIHKEAGKPDRRVLVCCKPCIAKFKRSPEKYLKILDEAEAAAAAKKN